MELIVLLDAKNITMYGYVKDILAFCATAFGLFAAVNGFNNNIKERKASRRLEQAKMARLVISEMHANKDASAAVMMMDWFSVDISYLAKFDEKSKDKIGKVQFNDVLAMLKKVNDANPKQTDSSFKLDDMEMVIVRCFDWFFYYIDRIEQYINDGMIQFDNVKHIFYPYHKKIYEYKENEEVFNAFMKKRDYELALQFWKRYKELESHSTD